MYSVTRRVEISSAHFIKGHGKCGKVHGHNFIIEVTVRSKHLNTENMVMDYNALKKKLEKIVGPIDHGFLNEIFGEMYVTSEFLARYIFEHLADEIQEPEVRLQKVRVYETENNWAEYYEV